MADACSPLSGCALQLPTSSRSYAGRTPERANVRTGWKADISVTIRLRGLHTRRLVEKRELAGLYWQVGGSGK